MSEVQPDSPQGIYDTLLELRLQNWAHEKDPQVTLTRAMEALDMWVLPGLTCVRPWVPSLAVNKEKFVPL